MTPVSHSTVQAFFEAYATRLPARIAPFLDDNVDWTISGPVEVLRFCGHRRGKKAVLEIFDRLVPETFEVTGFRPEVLLVDGDRAAMLGVLSGRRTGTSQRISYRVAQFLRFENDKIVEFQSILDSFDAAEQILGHALDLAERRTASDRTGAGDLIAV